MTQEQLDRLGALVSLFMTCAHEGGTPELTRVQAIVGDELNKLLAEIEEEKDKENAS